MKFEKRNDFVAPKTKKKITPTPHSQRMLTDHYSTESWESLRQRIYWIDASQRQHILASMNTYHVHNALRKVQNSNRGRIWARVRPETWVARFKAELTYRYKFLHDTDAYLES